MTDPEPRYLLFDAARRRADLSLQQLWLRYLGLGGSLAIFDLDAFLQGVMPLSAVEQDTLASAVNEALYDAYQAALVPFLGPAREVCVTEDPVAVLDELQRRGYPETDMS